METRSSKQNESNQPDSDSSVAAPDETAKLTTMQIVMSVFAAAFGVQNSKNRKRDFSQGNPIVFIIAGLMFTIAFVLTIISVVYLVL